MKQSRYCLTGCNYKAISIIVKLLQEAEPASGQTLTLKLLHLFEHSKDVRENVSVGKCKILTNARNVLREQRDFSASLCSCCVALLWLSRYAGCPDLINQV